MKKITKEDIQGNYTFTATQETEPITVDSMECIWKEAKIIPYKFKPTGEIVYVTPEMDYKWQKELKSLVPSEEKI